MAWVVRGCGSTLAAAADDDRAHHERGWDGGWLSGRGRSETRPLRTMGRGRGWLPHPGGVVRHGPPGTAARLTTNGSAGGHDRKTGGSGTRPYEGLFW